MTLLHLASALLLAAVEHVDPHDVPVGHALPLADLDVGVGDGGDGVLPVLDGEGCSSIVHDGGVVVGSVQVVGGLLVEVVGHLWVDVLPVDPDVAVAVAPGLFVLEAQSVVDLVLDDAVVHAALPVEREHLSASLFAQRGETSGFVLDADVVVLVLTGHEADAGLAVVGLHGVVNLLPLPAGELTTNGEGDHHQAVGSFLPHAALVPAHHGISGSGSQQVSFQQDLIGGVVGGQNPGGDVDSVFLFSSFLLERKCLREAEQEQQKQAGRGSHLQRGSGGCGAAVERLLEAGCLTQFSPGSLYSPLQVCLQEDYGLGSTLLGLNKPLKGGLHRQTYFLHIACYFWSVDGLTVLLGSLLG